jgi:hypothetical protein
MKCSEQAMARPNFNPTKNKTTLNHPSSAAVTLMILPLLLVAPPAQLSSPQLTSLLETLGIPELS